MQDQGAFGENGKGNGEEASRALLAKPVSPGSLWRFLVQACLAWVLG